MKYVAKFEIFKDKKSGSIDGRIVVARLVKKFANKLKIADERILPDRHLLQEELSRALVYGEGDLRHMPIVRDVVFLNKAPEGFRTFERVKRR